MTWYIPTWTWIALVRRFLCLVFRTEPRVTGSCRHCGNCCREIVLDVGNGWLRSKRQFEREKAGDRDLERFVIKGKDPDGRLLFACTWLSEEGLCRDYEHRLPLCSNHPSPSLYYSGVVLPSYCGYTLEGPGFGPLFRRWFAARKKPSFEAVLNRERTTTARRRDEDDTNG